MKNYNFFKDDSIPEEERIYTSSKKSWIRKTSKESARLYEQQRKKLEEDLKTRGLKPAVPSEEDQHIVKSIPIYVNGKKYPIEKHYIYDVEKREYRAYLSGTIYGDLVEIVFDIDKQYYVIMNQDKLRRQYKGENEDDLLSEMKIFFNRFCKEKF